MPNIKAYCSGKVRLEQLLVVLIGLVLSDGLISQSIISGGSGIEANLFLKDLIGGENFLLIKLAGALLAAFIIWNINKTRPGIAMVTSLVFMILYTGIVYWNITVFLMGQL